MNRIMDLRDEGPTAAYISDALRLQAEFGHEHACDYLKALGVDTQLAKRVLAIRYDRRRPSIATSVRVGQNAQLRAGADETSEVRSPA